MPKRESIAVGGWRPGGSVEEVAVGGWLVGMPFWTRRPTGTTSWTRRPTPASSPILQAEIDCSADTFLWLAYPDTNYGTFTTVSTGRVSGTNVRRSPLRFPSLPSISADSIIEAKLRLFAYHYYSAAGNRTITVYRLRRDDWHETQATWNIYKTGNAWGTAGAANTTSDYYTDDPATYQTPTSPSEGWVEFDVTEQVKSAIASGQYDCIVLGDESADSTAVLMRSRDYDGGSLAPELVIDYFAWTRRPTGGLTTWTRRTP